MNEGNPVTKVPGRELPPGLEPLEWMRLWTRMDSNKASSMDAGSSSVGDMQMCSGVVPASFPQMSRLAGEPQTPRTPTDVCNSEQRADQAGVGKSLVERTLISMFLMRNCGGGGCW